MTYVRLPAFGEFGATMVTQARPAEMISMVRRQAPSGSIVPTLGARRPAGLPPMSASAATAIRTARRYAKSRLQTLLRLPEKRLLVQARALQGCGLAGFSETPAGAVEALRELANDLRTAYEQIDGLGITPEAQSQLGGSLLAQRAGDISAALGVDVAWQDLVNNASNQFARTRQTLQGIDSGTILSTVGFEHISAMFTRQGQTVESLSSLAQGARGLYDQYGSEVLNFIAKDAAAFGEGGLRTLMEDALGEEAGKWLTGANLQRLSSVAQAWVGAGSSGSVSGYLTAAGATVGAVAIALAGASVAVPVGTIIAAVGALITLLAVFLGDEDPPPPPIEPCGSFPAWRMNPEAWTAMAMWLVSRDGKFFDSELYKEAQRRVVTVQQVAEEQGWFATFDPYTGEVMVRAPGLPGQQSASKRLLDVMDRDAFVLNWDDDGRGLGEPDVFRIFNEMRPAFGLQAVSRWSATNFLWCQPDQREVLTRFFGAEQFRIQTANPTTAFRSDPAKFKASEIGNEMDWSWVGEDWFWRLYTRTMVTSMYLAGTVPYGSRRVISRSRRSADNDKVFFSTGVGGSQAFHPMEVRAEQPGLWQPIPVPGAVAGAQLTQDAGELYSWTELPARLADQEWRLAHRVPVASPEVQTVPAETIRRPVGLRCGPPMPDGRRICARLLQRELAPLFAFKRAGEPAGDDIKTGMPTGAKIALGAAALALVGGGGYYLWSKSKERG